MLIRGNTSDQIGNHYEWWLVVRSSAPENFDRIGSGRSAPRHGRGNHLGNMPAKLLFRNPRELGYRVRSYTGYAYEVLGHVRHRRRLERKTEEKWRSASGCYYW